MSKRVEGVNFKTYVFGKSRIHSKIIRKIKKKKKKKKIKGKNWNK